MGYSGRFVAIGAFLIVGPAAALRADLRFLQPIVDAGTVRGGAPLAQTYRFVNEGPLPVVLTGAKVSCGCVTPQLEKRAYRAGESGEVTLAVHTLSQPAGPNTWRAAITYQEGETVRETALELKAQVIKEVLVQPAVMTVFADGEVKHQIQLTDLRQPPLNLKGVQTTSGRLQAEVGLPGRIDVRVPGDCPVGQHFEAVAIYTDDPAYPELRVPVTIVKRSRQAVKTVPEEVTVSGAKGEPLPSRIVLVRDADDRQIVVDQVTADDPAIACRFAPGPDTYVTVRIQLNPGRITGGQLDSSIRIRVLQPTQETLIVPVHCRIE